MSSNASPSDGDGEHGLHRPGRRDPLGLGNDANRGDDCKLGQPEATNARGDGLAFAGLGKP